VLTGHAVFRGAATLNDLLSEESVAFNGVGIATASTHLILPELNHADFRVQGFGFLNRPIQFRSFEIEHSTLLNFVPISIIDREKYRQL
jgi:hypothetical protein